MKIPLVPSGEDMGGSGKKVDFQDVKFSGDSSGRKLRSVKCLWGKGGGQYREGSREGTSKRSILRTDCEAVRRGELDNRIGK